MQKPVSQDEWRKIFRGILKKLLDATEIDKVELDSAPDRRTQMLFCWCKGDPLNTYSFCLGRNIMNVPPEQITGPGISIHHTKWTEHHHTVPMFRCTNPDHIPQFRDFKQYQNYVH